jgi:hypothetical protein
MSAVRILLLEHGEQHISARLLDLDHRLLAGDKSAVRSAVSEATGSMGSLNDRILSASNGDDIERWRESSINARLRRLIDAMRERAFEARRDPQIS